MTADTMIPGDPVPVTLLSGFLGSGKTTLMKNILEQTHAVRPDMKKYKVAVLVNDMAEVNIDATLVRDTKLLQREEKLVELHNGCICCTLREDLIKELADLASQNKFDAIVVESTGVSDPQEVAETFAVEVAGPGTQENAPEDWELASIVEKLRGKSSLNELARLDTCVTMVDCAAFKANLSTAAELQDKFKGSADEGDDRNVGPLLMNQIEFADVILVSKCDLVTEEEALSVERAIRALNPGAKVMRAHRGDIPLANVLDTKLFSMEKASKSAGWLQQMRGEKVVPETEVYGIESFVYKARTPFHPKRFEDFLIKYFLVKMMDTETIEEEPEEPEDGAEDMETDSSAEEKCQKEAEEADAMTADRLEAESSKRQAIMRQDFGNILRSKGYIWLAGRDDMVGEWSQAGAIGEFSCGGFWYASVPKELWPEKGTPQYEMLMKDVACPVLMDRRQEIVFIGQNLNEEAIRNALDDCLVKQEELRRRGRSASVSVHGWKLGLTYLEDSFPLWVERAEHDHHHHEMEEEDEEEEVQDKASTPLKEINQ